MKKLLALLLVAVMMFAFTACSREDVRGTITDKDPAPGSSDVDTDEEVSQPESEETFELGGIGSGNYTNAFLNIGCRLPSGWTYYSDEQIRELNNLVGDMVDEEIAEQLEDASSIYDMHAVAGDGMNNVNVVLQNVGYFGVTDSNIQASLQASLEPSKQALESMGYENVRCEVTRTSFCGKTLHGMTIESEIQGLKTYQRQACFAKGKYLVAVTATTYGKDDTQSILNAFYSLA